MTAALLAAGLGDWIIPVLVLLFYGVASLLKTLGEKKAAPARRPPQAKRPPAPRPPQPERMELPPQDIPAPPPQRPPAPQPATDVRVELERMLRELGVGTNPTPVPTPPPRQRKKEKPKPTPGKQKQPDRTPRRELHSRLESRHAEDVHSGLESQHIESKIAAAKAAAPVLTGHQLNDGQVVLHNLLTQPQLLTHAYMLGVVLGPPLALQNDRPNP